MRTPQQIRAEADARVREVVGSLDVPAGCALVATGSLARGEMTAFSDCDVFLLIDDSRGTTPAAQDIEALWYPFWDAKLRLDYSARTVAETVEVMASDPRVALAVLDMTLLAGDEELFDAARAKVLAAWRRLVAKRFDDVIDQVHHRWKNTGSLADMISPDLKHGRGGLRDGELLRALSLGHLCDMPDLRVPRQLIVDTRVLVHESAGRPRDILDPEFASEIAPLLRMPDRFALSRRVAASARAIDYAVQRGLTTARDAIPRHRSLNLRAKRRVPLDLDVMISDNQVELADKPDFFDPELPLRMAAAAVRAKRELSAGALDRLAKNWRPGEIIWTASMRSNFCCVLGAGEQVAELVNALHVAGLWSRYVPEWEAIAGLLPAEPIHVRTIDQHTLEALRLVSPAVTQVARPDLLLLSVFFHDLAKGKGVPHEAEGARLALSQMANMGFSESECEIVARVVGKHSLIARLAARYNPASSEAIGSVVKNMGDPVAIEILGVLTRADAQATGVGVWTNSLANAVDTIIPAAIALTRESCVASGKGKEEDLLSWSGSADEIAALIDTLNRFAWRLNYFAFRRGDRINAEFHVNSLIGDRWNPIAVRQSVRHLLQRGQGVVAEPPGMQSAGNFYWDNGRTTIKVPGLDSRRLKLLLFCEAIRGVDIKDLGAVMMVSVEITQGSEEIVSEVLGKLVED
nr:DUF294 nucleotidyltransferase-like domain-containing protein [Corynebacterium lactis]